eukprot:4469453-Lingulodinium_polyedra.AAC.1
MREHSAAVQAATVKGFRCWQHYQRFSRKPCNHVRNIIDVCWVIIGSGLKTLGRRSVSFVR